MLMALFLFRLKYLLNKQLECVWLDLCLVMLIVVIFQREVENYSFRGVICNEI